MFLSATVLFRRACVQGLFGNSGQTDRNWRSPPRQITFPIKIRDENRFQARFWCKDRHATGAETCLLIWGPWFAKPLLFAWWAVRCGFSFAGLPRGLAGFQWPASVLADPKGCSGMDSSQGHQMWAHARCARCVLQCICSPCTHTRSLSTVGCSTIRSSVANLSRPSAGLIPNGIQRALQ